MTASLPNTRLLAVSGRARRVRGPPSDRSPARDGRRRLRQSGGHAEHDHPLDAASGSGLPPRVKLLPGLPAAIAQKLRYENVVVVSLYGAKAPGDRKALAHARVGAKKTGAGFVALNVFDERKANALVKFLGNADSPAVLVVRRPGTVVTQIDGFVDAEIVAQAAQNAGARKKPRSRSRVERARALHARSTQGRSPDRDPARRRQGGRRRDGRDEGPPAGAKPDIEPRQRPFAFGSAEQAARFVDDVLDARVPQLPGRRLLRRACNAFPAGRSPARAEGRQRWLHGSRQGPGALGRTTSTVLRPSAGLRRQRRPSRLPDRPRGSELTRLTLCPRYSRSASRTISPAAPVRTMFERGLPASTVIETVAAEPGSEAIGVTSRCSVAIGTPAVRCGSRVRPGNCVPLPLDEEGERGLGCRLLDPGHSPAQGVDRLERPVSRRDVQSEASGDLVELAVRTAHPRGSKRRGSGTGDPAPRTGSAPPRARRRPRPARGRPRRAARSSWPCPSRGDGRRRSKPVRAERRSRARLPPGRHRRSVHGRAAERERNAHAMPPSRPKHERRRRHLRKPGTPAPTS